MLIAFFGVDGAGKTTQVRLLSEELKQKSVKHRTAWVRSPHALAFYAWKFLTKTGYKRVLTNKHGYRLELPRINSSRIMKEIWGWFEVFNIVPIVILKVLIPLRLGYVVVAERFTPDSIATISHFIADEEFLNSRAARVLLSLIPNGTLFIHLKCDYETLEKRRGSMTEPRDSSLFQEKIASKLAEILDAISINTSDQSVEETHEKIFQYIRSNNPIDRITND